MKTNNDAMDAFDWSQVRQGMAFKNKEGYLRIFECWSIYPNSCGEKVGIFTSPQKISDQHADREHPASLIRCSEKDLPPLRRDETLRTALEQSQRDADIIEGLHGTIKSQKQTHDALVKKCREFEAQAEQDRAAIKGLDKTLVDIGGVNLSEFTENPECWMFKSIHNAVITLKTHAAAIKRAGETHE